MAEVKLIVHLTALQLKSLKEHAARKKRPPEEDIVQVWWGRVCALDTYAGKMEKKNRRPRPAPPKQRAAIREAAKRSRRVVKPARKLTYRIDLYDEPRVAMSKARMNTTSEEGMLKMLKAAGRDRFGVLGRKS